MRRVLVGHGYNASIAAHAIYGSEVSIRGNIKIEAVSTVTRLQSAITREYYTLQFAVSDGHIDDHYLQTTLARSPHLHHGSSNGGSILDASKIPHGPYGVQRSVHHHRVERDLSVAIRMASKPCGKM